MKYISYILFRLLIAVFSLIPFKFLYFISDIFRFFLKNIFGYRTSVIKQNIAFVFPEKSEEWQTDVFNGFYKNFIDIIFESIKGLSVNPKKLVYRYRLNNPGILDKYYEQSKHVIIYSQHCNNWEWASLCMGFQMKHYLVGAAKVISNPYIDAYILKGRSGNNVNIIHTNQIGKFFQNEIEEMKPVGVVFIADQRPSGKEKKTPVQFFGKTIDFHGGAAKYAVQAGYPIIAIDIHRIGRGRYEAEAVILSNQGEIKDADTLTQVYASHVEQLISKDPTSWLWSHKRFKNEISY